MCTETYKPAKELTSLELARLKKNFPHREMLYDGFVKDPNENIGGQLWTYTRECVSSMLVIVLIKEDGISYLVMTHASVGESAGELIFGPGSVLPKKLPSMERRG